MNKLNWDLGDNASRVHFQEPGKGSRRKGKAGKKSGKTKAKGRKK